MGKCPGHHGCSAFRTRSPSKTIRVFIDLDHGEHGMFGTMSFLLFEVIAREISLSDQLAERQRGRRSIPGRFAVLCTNPTGAFAVSRTNVAKRILSIGNGVRLLLSRGIVSISLGLFGGLLRGVDVAKVRAYMHPLANQWSKINCKYLRS